MNEKRNHFQQYLPQTEVAATAEIAAGLKIAPQSLETVWDAVPCIQEAAAPIKKRACLRPFIYYVCTKGGGGAHCTKVQKYVQGKIGLQFCANSVVGH